MRGIHKLAYKLLVNDKAKFTALLVGITFAVFLIIQMRLPDYAALITYWNLSLAFVMVVIIAAISSYFGVRKVLRIEAFDIFRG